MHLCAHVNLDISMMELMQTVYNVPHNVLPVQALLLIVSHVQTLKKIQQLFVQHVKEIKPCQEVIVYVILLENMN
jgi:hypothetical protein